MKTKIDENIEICRELASLEPFASYPQAQDLLDAATRLEKLKELANQEPGVKEGKPGFDNGWKGAETYYQSKLKELL